MYKVEAFYLRSVVLQFQGSMESAKPILHAM